LWGSWLLKLINNTFCEIRAHLLAEDVEALLVAVDRVVVEEPAREGRALLGCVLLLYYSPA